MSSTRRAFVRDASALAAARRFVADFLDSEECAPLGIESAMLLTSELATSSVLHDHGATTFTVTVRHRVHSVEIAVSGAAIEPDRRCGDRQPRSLAMRLIDELACSWGVHNAPDGHATFVELECCVTR